MWIMLIFFQLFAARVMDMHIIDLVKGVFLVGLMLR